MIQLVTIRPKSLLDTLVPSTNEQDPLRAIMSFDIGPFELHILYVVAYERLFTLYGNKMLSCI